MAADIVAPTEKESFRLLRTEYLRIIARFFNVGYDKLYQREKRRKRHRAAMLTIFTAMLISVLSVLGMKIRANQVEIKNKKIDSLCAASIDLWNEGRPVDSVNTAKEALALGNNDYHIATKAANVLTRELSLFSEKQLVPKKKVHYHSYASSFGLVNDASELIVSDMRTGIAFYDITTGELIRELKNSDIGEFFWRFPLISNDRVFVVVNNGGEEKKIISGYSCKTKEKMWSQDVSLDSMTIDGLNDELLLSWDNTTRAMTCIDIETGKTAETISFANYPDLMLPENVFLIYDTINKYLYVIDWESDVPSCQAFFNKAGVAQKIELTATTGGQKFVICESGHCFGFIPNGNYGFTYDCIFFSQTDSSVDSIKFIDVTTGEQKDEIRFSGQLVNVQLNESELVVISSGEYKCYQLENNTAGQDPHWRSQRESHFNSKVKSCSYSGDVIAVSDASTDVYIYENRQNPYMDYLSDYLNNNRYIHWIEIDDESGYAVVNICEKKTSYDSGKWYYYSLSDEMPNLNEIEFEGYFGCFLSGGKVVFYSSDSGVTILDLFSGQVEIREDLNPSNLIVSDKNLLIYDRKADRRKVEIFGTGMTFDLPEGVISDMAYNANVGLFAALIGEENQYFLQVNDFSSNIVKRISIDGFQPTGFVGGSGSVSFDRLFWIGKDKIGVVNSNSIYCIDIEDEKCITVVKPTVDLLGYEYLPDVDLLAAININMELCYLDSFAKGLIKNDDLELIQSGVFVEITAPARFDWDYIDSHNSILLSVATRGTPYMTKAWILSNKTKNILFEIPDFDQYSKLEDRFYIYPYILKFPFGYSSSDIYTIPFYGADDLIKCADEIKSMSKE